MEVKQILFSCPEEWKCLDEFLTWYRRMKITGIYTDDVCTYIQPKGVGKRPFGAKQKGPSQYYKPKIGSSMDPLGTQSSILHPMPNSAMASVHTGTQSPTLQLPLPMNTLPQSTHAAFNPTATFANEHIGTKHPCSLQSYSYLYQ